MDVDTAAPHLHSPELADLRSQLRSLKELADAGVLDSAAYMSAAQPLVARICAAIAGPEQPVAKAKEVLLHLFRRR